MTFTPNVFPTMLNQPLKGLVQIINATGAGQVTVVTPGGNGSKVLNLIASSNDTVAHTVIVAIIRSATSFFLAATSVPASAGVVAGTPPVDLLAVIPNLPHDQDGQPYLFLNSGDALVVSVSTGSVTSGDAINVHSDYANF
jgi:hypothetical protein